MPLTVAPHHPTQACYLTVFPSVVASGVAPSVNRQDVASTGRLPLVLLLIRIALISIVPMSVLQVAVSIIASPSAVSLNKITIK